MCNTLFAQVVDHISKRANIIHLNSKQKQFVSGGDIYNYRNTSGIYLKGSSDIVDWADSTADGNYLISALSNLITEFPPISNCRYELRILFLPPL